MNSNSDYTICNLDNHTYSSSNYSTAESVGNSAGGYAHHHGYGVHNNGIVDTGQLGYGAAAAMHHGPGPEPGLPGGPVPPPPPPSHQTAAHHPPPPHLYQGGGLLSAGSPPPGAPGGYPGIHHGSTCMTGPAGHHPGMPYGDYYPNPAGVITNGGLDCSTGGYPYPHHDPQGPCITTSGYGLPNHHHSQGQGSPPQDQTPVATYKWMTVKRNGPKPGMFEFPVVPFKFPCN